MLTKGDAKRFLRGAGRVRAEIDEAVKRETHRPASVELPERADGYVRVKGDKARGGVEFALKDAHRADLEVADGTASYPGAAPSGGDVFMRVTKTGVEDFVVLDAKPANSYLDYTVNVGEIAGLRLYANSLEFLEKDGDLALRVDPPLLTDADGAGRWAKLSLLDCKADTSPEVPWDRPVTAPGARECTVRVSWDDAKLVYPIIVDPVWSSAADMGTARYEFPALKLGNGRTLVCGGLDSIGDPSKTCEIFNPAGGLAGEGAWAATGAMNTARYDFNLVWLNGQIALAVGGEGTPTSERFNGTIWTASIGDLSGNPCPSCSAGDSVAATSDFAYVVNVWYTGQPKVWVAATNTWITGNANPAPTGGVTYRYNAPVLGIPGQGTIMRAGGTWYPSGTVHLKTVERYKPSIDPAVVASPACIPACNAGEYCIANGNCKNPWQSPGDAASLGSAHGNPAGMVLDGNRIMIYGGQNLLGASLKAEIYSGSANAWTDAAGDLPNGSYVGQTGWGQTYALLGTSKFMLAPDGGPFIFDPAATSAPFSVISTYPYNFNSYGSQGNVTSAGTKVLMVPVQPTNSVSQAQKACKLFDFGDKGSFCSTNSECKSGLTCVYDQLGAYIGGGDNNSVCCDSSCTDACSSCRAVHKTSGLDDGTCGPRKATEYVNYVGTNCASTDQSTCGTKGGYCDGAGKCANWDTSTYCGPQSCADSVTQNNTRYCDGKGACANQTTSACSTGYACVTSQNGCANGYCSDDSWCQTGYFCQYFAPPYQTCQPKKADGQSCTDGFSNAECKNGHCVDGVCCDTGCTETCKSCLNSETGQATGTCSFIPATSAAPKDCFDQGSASCASNGKCNGAGACQLYASGTVCADAGSCASETVRNIPDTCNGTGTCSDKGTQACATGYSCQSGTCNTQCTSDAMCASAYYCDIPNKACVLDKAQGQSCLRDQACQGNANCVEIDAVTKLGVCCNSGCAGDCQSCLTVNTGLGDGTCGNVLDDLDPKNKCAQGAAYPSSCAAPGLCNGQGGCRPYAKSGVECDTDVCTDSTLTTYQCNGAGTCKAKATQCYPFKCDTTNNVCRVACTDKTEDQDCVTGSHCENGSCVGQLQNGQACTRGAQCGSSFCANIHEGTLQGDTTVGPGGGGSGGGGSGGGGSGGGGSGGGGSGGIDTGGGGSGGGGSGGTAGADPGDDLPGVCCDQACNGTCSGCKASIKGFGSDGVCEFVKNNTDPANDCEKATNDPCGLDGQCNGAGACRLAPSGTSCGASSCQGNSVLGQSCDGSGDCINNQGGVDCAPYVCRDVMGAFQCTNPCAEDNDCQDGYYCSDAACKKKLSNSKACDNGTICGSGYCVDGVCCDTSCNGQCEACDAAGSEGSCTPVKGDPHGTRAACDHAGDECGGQCDGVNASSCKYAANGTSCGTTTCDNALAKSSTCDGQGECRANKDTECSPYNCGPDDTCLSRCNTTADCTQGYACDATTQRCLPSAVAATCSDDRLTSKGQNGNDTPCKPFLCVPASGTCAVSCAFTTDCSPDFVCEPSTKTCLPAPTGTGDDGSGSCACRAAGGSPNRSSFLALAALGVAFAGLRRRRHSRRASRPTGKPLGCPSNSQPHE